MAESKQHTVTYEEDQRKTRRTSFVWYPGDDDILDYVVQYLGCSKSEAVRSALRAYAMHLQGLSR